MWGNSKLLRHVITEELERTVSNVHLSPDVCAGVSVSLTGSSCWPAGRTLADPPGRYAGSLTGRPTGMRRMSGQPSAPPAARLYHLENDRELQTVTVRCSYTSSCVIRYWDGSGKWHVFGHAIGWSMLQICIDGLQMIVLSNDTRIEDWLWNYY